MAGMSRPGMLWPGTAGLVEAGGAGHGMAWWGRARQGEARHRRLGTVCLGMARLGWPWHGFLFLRLRSFFNED
jgi:hypothetical protein